MSGFLHLSDFHLVEDETLLSRAFNAKYILKNTIDKIATQHNVSTDVMYNYINKETGE